MVMRLRSPENKKKTNIRVPQPVKPSDKKKINNNKNKWKETGQK